MINLRQKRRLGGRIDRLSATPFQKKVWKALLTIPKGEVRSYSWVARKVRSPRAVRAVGNALNKNPLAPLVPCHRIVRKDGTLGGFANGPAKKRALLKKEGCSNYFRRVRTASTVFSTAKSISSSVVNRPKPNRIEDRALSSPTPNAKMT